MRIALCLSGQMRNFKAVYEVFKQTILQPLNADVFIDTWEEAGSSPKGEKNSEQFEKTEVTEELLETFFAPKLVNVEPFYEKYFEQIDNNSIPDWLTAEHPRARSSLPMYYKMFRCDLLRRDYESKNGFRYDWVVRARPDIYLDKPLFITESHGEKALMRLSPGPKYEHVPYFIWDTFFVADSKTMSDICDIWKILPEYWPQRRLSLPGEEGDSSNESSNMDTPSGSRLLTKHVRRLAPELITLSNRCFIERRKDKPLGGEDQPRLSSSWLHKLVKRLVKRLGHN